LTGKRSAVLACASFVTLFVSGREAKAGLGWAGRSGGFSSRPRIAWRLILVSFSSDGCHQRESPNDSPSTGATDESIFSSFHRFVKRNRASTCLDGEGARRDERRTRPIIEDRRRHRLDCFAGTKTSPAQEGECFWRTDTWRIDADFVQLFTSVMRTATEACADYRARPDDWPRARRTTLWIHSVGGGIISRTGAMR